MDRIILSHNSALAALRALPPQTGRLTRVEEPLRLAEIRTSAKTLAAFHSEALGIGSPLHILSATSAARPRGAGVTSHRLGLYEIPAGLLWRLEPNVYVCGPELTFIQMAMQLGPVGRSVLGHELCGAWESLAKRCVGFEKDRALPWRRWFPTCSSSRRAREGTALRRPRSTIG